MGHGQDAPQPTEQPQGAETDTVMGSRKIGDLRLERLPGALQRKEYMAGLRVLVLGESYNFICREAVRQDAARVVQLLDAPPAQPRESRAFRHVEIREGDLSALGSERFDVIFLPEAQSRTDLQGFLRSIADHLRPKAVLVMECALSSSATGIEWTLCSDAESARRYPSTRLLETVLLEDYALRRVGRGVLSNPDRMPQALYHCTPLQSTALLIAGKSGHGKSNLLRHFNPVDFPAISTDHFLSRLAKGKIQPDTALVGRIRAEIGEDVANWGKVGRMIAAEPALVDSFCRLLITTCPLEARIFILEGEILRHENLAGALVTLLKENNIRVWTAMPASG